MVRTQSREQVALTAGEETAARREAAVLVVLGTARAPHFI
jgi:hypothetical protein